MPYVCSDPEKYRGKSIGSGECVDLVRVATGAPHTSSWRAGAHVKEAAAIQSGTAIATFFKGKYPSNSTGNHAAIYLGHGPGGIEVLDQWDGHAAGVRTIAYKKGSNDPSNDGDFYYVIE
jgi:hypothetical protein